MIYAPSASNKGQGPAPSWIQHIHGWILHGASILTDTLGVLSLLRVGELNAKATTKVRDQPLFLLSCPIGAVPVAATRCLSFRDMLLISSLYLDTTQIVYTNTCPSRYSALGLVGLTVVFYASKASPDETLGYYASSEHEAQPTRSYRLL